MEQNINGTGTRVPLPQRRSSFPKKEDVLLKTINPTFLVFAPLLTLIASGACMTGPQNGTTVSETIQGKSISFNGYYYEPNIPIHVQILRTPTSNPALEEN